MKRQATLIVSLLLIASSAFAASSTLVAKGKYLTTAGDCVSCHTASGGQPFAGGRSLPTPFGTVYAPNITPDAETGIGDWSFADFWQALHFGKRANGDFLYPVFSYTSFTRVTKGDAKAIFAYLQSLEPVKQEDKSASLDFPYNIRPLLFAWRTLYFEPGVYQPNPEKSNQWNRGAYLVKGLGHCNQCHTTRNALGAMDKENLLSGGKLSAQGWYAPDLSMKKGGGLEGWTQQDVVDLLKTGTSAKGSVFGPMAEVVRNSTQYLTQDDLEAIATYLDTLPAATAKTANKSVAKAANYKKGKAIFNEHCRSCHGKKGEGVASVYPPLKGNSTVLDPTGLNAVRSVLLGGFPPATKGNPMPYSMPPFAYTLNDKQVAAVVNYIRQSWGNMAAPVTPAQVATYRAIPTR